MSKKKERRIEGSAAKVRKRRFHCQEPLVGASQLTPRNSFSSGSDKAVKCYLLCTYCVAIKSSVE